MIDRSGSFASVIVPISVSNNNNQVTSSNRVVSSQRWMETEHCLSSVGKRVSDLSGVERASCSSHLSEPTYQHREHGSQFPLRNRELCVCQRFLGRSGSNDAPAWHCPPLHGVSLRPTKGPRNNVVKEKKCWSMRACVNQV